MVAVREPIGTELKLLFQYLVTQNFNKAEDDKLALRDNKREVSPNAQYRSRICITPSIIIMIMPFQRVDEIKCV